jgi:hypothetical protein
MLKKILTLALSILFFGLTSQAQTTPDKNKKTTPEPAVSEQKLTAKDYEELVKKLKDGDTSIDFVKLRLAYTETKDYAPYGGSTERGEMLEALNEEKFEDALKTAEDFLKTNYVDLHSHFVAAVANRMLKKEKQAQFHMDVLKGLMDAILENDGLTAKTAMISIGISEQYFVMSYLGFQRQSKALLREDGSIFDVHTAENGETGETRKFYFNIDKVFGRF